VCTITDPRLLGLSGLVATESGFVTVTDSNGEKSAIKIYVLDLNCKVTKSIAYPTPAFDPEDVAMGKDGTIWVADIGDNYRERQPPGGRGIGLWKLAANSTTPQLFRYSYPDAAHDAEAILLAADDSPIFVTKDSEGSKLYVPTAAPDPSGKAVPLKEVGSFKPQHTGTPNSLSVVGEKFVTGGANSPDRKKVVLRTYSDAYEWDVPDGDVVKAITTTQPRITALPNENAGEGIAYSPDGSVFYTVEDTESAPLKTPIRKYTPNNKAPTAAAKPTKSDSGGGLPLTLSQITYLVIGVGVLGLVLLVGGVMGIARSRNNRKRRRDDDWDDEYGDDYGRGGQQPRRGGNRGGRPPGRPAGGYPPSGGGFPPPGPAYGGAPASAGGTVYGRGGGHVYGGGQAGNQEPYQSGYPQSGYEQGYQGGYDQGGYGHDQGGYDQRAYDQGGYDQGGYDQGGYDQGGYDHSGYAQGYQDHGHQSGYPDQQYDGYSDRRR